METYLAPIEKPRGLIMKLVYAATRRRFGKVLTPLKVLSPRLPLAFGSWYGKIATLEGRLHLRAELALLLRQQVARINVCEFCMDIGRYVAIQQAHAGPKFDALDSYQTSGLFSDAERAALDYVTLLTREKRMNEETFDRLREHFSEREICEIAWLVASEHVYNMTNIGLNIHSDMLCDLGLKARALSGTAAA